MIYPLNNIPEEIAGIVNGSVIFLITSNGLSPEHGINLFQNLCFCFGFRTLWDTL